MTTHAEAEVYARAGYRARYDGNEPNDNLVIAMLCWSQGETYYGDSWERVCNGNGIGSNNIGAAQATQQWVDDGGQYFWCRDTRPKRDADGNVYHEPYDVRFRKFATPEDGWADYVQVLFQNRGREKARHAAEEGRWYDFCAAEYDSGYYEGRFPERELAIADRYRGFVWFLQRTARVLDHLQITDVPPRSIKRGMHGEDVEEVQVELGHYSHPGAHVQRYWERHPGKQGQRIAVDGIAGEEFVAWVSDFQAAHTDPIDGAPLKVDGEWGPASRRAMNAVKDHTDTEPPAQPPPTAPGDDEVRKAVAAELDAIAETLSATSARVQGTAAKLRG